MWTENRIRIEAPWTRVFEAVAAVERWPLILSHYRKVDVLAGRGARRVVSMSAHRDGIPCRWVSDMRLERARRRIFFHHTESRFTRGMDVWWIFKPAGPRATEVLLTHERAPKGGLRGWFDQTIVADLFVHVIAARTQAGIKKHLEQA